MKKGKFEAKKGDNKELNKETGRTGISPTAGLRHMNWRCILAYASLNAHSNGYKANVGIYQRGK